MDFQFELPQRTLSTEQQSVLDAVNHLITILPDQPDLDVSLRLGLMILEVAEVAPQAELAEAAGFSQDRSVRVYKERLKEQGLAGLFDRPMTGRPAITTQTPVEKAFIQVVLAAVIEDHALPEDVVLAERVNQALGESQASEAGQVTASMVETLRLRWDIHRLPLQQALDTASTPTTAPAAVQLGRTQVGGAFVLAILLVETGWLKLAQGLPMVPGYAVTATQWSLTAIFSVIFGIQRAFHLDEVCDIGFALVTGRARPLSHGTFLHTQSVRSFPEKFVQKFYARSAKREVERFSEGPRRISIDGHNVARYTKVVDLEKGKIGNTGRILKAEELVWAFDLDAHLWLAMRAYQGTNKLSQALVEIVREILKHRGPNPNPLRLFFDKGGSCGHVFRDLLKFPSVFFYTFAKRTEENVAAWELLPDSAFGTVPFTFDKHADLPADQRPAYRLADTEMTINVWEDDHLVETVTLRAIARSVHDPQGEKPAERWPVVLLTSPERSRRVAHGMRAPCSMNRAITGAKNSPIALVGMICSPTSCPLATCSRLPAMSRENCNAKSSSITRPSSCRLGCIAWSSAFGVMTLFAHAMGGDYPKLWAGTLLRKFIRRPATLYLIGKELHVVFDPFPGQEELQPLLDKLNDKRVGLPWLNNLIVQLSIAQGAPIYPLTEPEKRNRLFGDG